MFTKVFGGTWRGKMDKYLSDNNEVNYKPCKKYYDGYCWDNPSWYCSCDYEGCQPLCEEYEEDEVNEKNI